VDAQHPESVMLMLQQKHGYVALRESVVHEWGSCVALNVETGTLLVDMGS